MLTWWGIMLDLVDTPYRGWVLCLLGGALCSTSGWGIMHHLCMAHSPHEAYYILYFSMPSFLVAVYMASCFSFR